MRSGTGRLTGLYPEETGARGPSGDTVQPIADTGVVVTGIPAPVLVFFYRQSHERIFVFRIRGENTQNTVVKQNSKSIFVRPRSNNNLTRFFNINSEGSLYSA